MFTTDSVEGLRKISGDKYFGALYDKEKVDKKTMNSAYHEGKIKGKIEGQIERKKE